MTAFLYPDGNVAVTCDGKANVLDVLPGGPTDFAQWLREHREKRFRPRDSCYCPLAQWSQRRLSTYALNLLTPWARDFGYKVDALAGDEMGSEDALNLLDGATAQTTDGAQCPTHGA